MCCCAPQRLSSYQRRFPAASLLPSNEQIPTLIALSGTPMLACKKGNRFACEAAYGGPRKTPAANATYTGVKMCKGIGKGGRSSNGSPIAKSEKQLDVLRKPHHTSSSREAPIGAESVCPPLSPPRAQAVSRSHASNTGAKKHRGKDTNARP